MSWVRLDDGFADHPKIAELSDRAFRVHVWALCYCARHLTDGFVAEEALARCPLVTRRYTADHARADLIGARLWKARKGGIGIGDYLTYNPNGAQVKAKRRQAAARQAQWRERQEQRRNAPSNAVTPKPVTHPPSPPPKAGKKEPAPGGAALPLDDCMRCEQLWPLRDVDGLLLCEDCERKAA